MGGERGDGWLSVSPLVSFYFVYFFLTGFSRVPSNSSHSVSASTSFFAFSASPLLLPLPCFGEIKKGEGGGLRLGKAAKRFAQYSFAASVQVEWVSEWQRLGSTVILLQTAGVVLGCIALRDALQPEAASVVDALKQRGVSVWVCSGDSAAASAAAAAFVGVEPDKVVAEVLPKQKAALITLLRQQQQDRGNGSVGIMGDGVNDSPALAAGDLSFAVGAGAALAVNSASVVVVSNDLRGVICFLELAAALRRTTIACLLWACGFNLLGLPAACGLLLLIPGSPLLISPPIAAALMALSSVLVIHTASTLRYFRPPALSGDSGYHAYASDVSSLELLRRHLRFLFRGPRSFRARRLEAAERLAAGARLTDPLMNESDV
ncbi:heavy metal translocating P-type ATPase subfamily protein [Cyclospora cayetanensis]|uniref:Heavy metal translocating P-type ATPase subfamily protein n=1 Tax=Cyclospora cayetanensis TaxID=88456 RepID=A0A1D3D5J4_9EIME|nr:heavy metal translocating P-type ATPase subfamily protein [Cyclospora cayetanensis]